MLYKLLTKMGALLDVLQSESLKVLDKLLTVHIVQDVIVPTHYNASSLKGVTSLQNQAEEALNKALDVLYGSQIF